jgi:hypothetical protein
MEEIGMKATMRQTLFRSFSVAVILVSCLSTAGWAQSSGDVAATSARARSAAKGPAKTKPAEGGSCQIGVIPIAGTLFHVDKIGPIKLADTYERASVDRWALDELVVARVRAAAPGMSVRRIQYTREELRNEPRQRSTSLFRSTADAVKEFAQYLAPRIHCDRYVVIHRHGGSQREFGIGISKHYLADHANLFAMMYIRVYDGRSFQLTNEAPALMEEDTYLNRFKYHLGGPSRRIDLAMFPEKPADAVTNPVLRDGVREMLTISLDRTLPGMLRPQPREAAR